MTHKIYCSKCSDKTEVYYLTETGTHVIYRCKGHGAHTTWLDKEAPVVTLPSARPVQRPFSAA